MDFTYHSGEDLQSLGEMIRDQAADLSVNEWMGDDFGDAQQRLINQNTQLGAAGSIPYGQEPTTDDVRRFIVAENADVPGLFAAFGVPDPVAIQPNVDALNQAAATLRADLTVTATGDGTKVTAPPNANPLGLTPVGETMTLVDHRLVAWEGQAAEAFKLYVAKFPTASEYQRQVVLSLALTLQAQMEIRKRMITDIWNIGQDTIKAMQAAAATCHSAKSVSLELTVASAFAGIALAITASGDAVIVAGLSSAAAILGKVAQPAEQVTIGGRTVQLVLTSMRAAITTLHRTVTGQQDQLVRAVQSVQSDLTKLRPSVDLPAPTHLLDLSSAGLDVPVRSA